MKKLLSVLGTLSMATPITITNTATSLTHKDLVHSNYSLEGFKNIVKILNQKNNISQNLDNKEVDSFLDEIIPNYYFDSVNAKKGKVLVWNTTPQNDTQIIKTYSNTYINDSDFEQKRLTQSRTEEITESHSFSMSLSENIVSETEVTLKASFEVPVGGLKEEVKFKFGKETGNKQEWRDTTTVSTKETVPSQEIIQGAHTILHVKYTISQGTTQYDGIVQFRISNLKEKVFKIPFFYFDDQGNFDYVKWYRYSAEEIIEVLKDAGYGEVLKLENNSEYSIISVDNLHNPKNVFVNLPISWSAQESGIRLEHYEEKIK